MFTKQNFLFIFLMLILFAAAGCDEGGTDRCGDDPTYTNTITINGNTFNIATEDSEDYDSPKITYDPGDPDRLYRVVFLDVLPAEGDKAALEIHFAGQTAANEIPAGSWTGFSENGFIGVGLYHGDVEETTDYLDTSYYYETSSSTYTGELTVSGNEATGNVTIVGSFAFTTGDSFSISYSGTYDWEELYTGE